MSSYNHLFFSSTLNKLHYKGMDKSQKILDYDLLKKLGEGSFG